MRICLLMLAVLFTVTTLFSAATASATDAELTAKEKADGWILLFDGKSLAGWTTSTKAPSKRPVEEGSLNPHMSGGYMLIHEKPWADFVLALDFKISKGCNSGIFLRTFPLEPRPGKDVGFNGIEVAVDDTSTAGFHDTGAIYDLVKPTKNAMRPVGEWNHIEITCDNNLISVVLNGDSVNRIDLDQWNLPNRRPDGSEHKFDIAYKNHPRQGYIGLQDHGSNCWYKNIKLRPLNASKVSTARPPTNAGELRFWLENMVWYHHFTDSEISEVTGLNPSAIPHELDRLEIRRDHKPTRAADAPLLVLPYPGGRHPRIGFLDGAVRPQRETKVSVFTPWDEKSYVVVDVPEAIWSNLGLIYLAHTHVPTVWTKQNKELEPLEWNRRQDGTFDIERKLPNGIVFGAKVVPGKAAVQMELWLTNGTSETLSDLRVQNCVMLKGAAGFEEQANTNKLFAQPYAVARSKSGKQWVITAWEPCHRAWGNASCPCLHSDPKFPDCAPGKTEHLRGMLSFYEGDDIDAELRRLTAAGTLHSPR